MSYCIICYLFTRIDHTYKIYYGGSQKRPDGCYSRPVFTASEKKIFAYVSESNRKDIRNAVEAAHKASSGWGKRAAHNRYKIVITFLQIKF